MEGLYKTTPGKRASISTSAARRRPVAEKFHSRYQPRHLADNLAGNGCHHSNKRTRSQISRRASSKTRAISIWTRSSRSWQIVDWCPAHHRYRVRSNSSSGGSSRSRSHSPVDSNRGQSCDSDYIDGNWSSQEPCRYKQEARSLWRWRCCRSRASLTSRRPRSPLPHKQVKNHHPDGLDIIKQLFAPLVLPSSVTTVIAAPVTGTTSTGQGNGGSGAINNPSVGNSIDNKHPSTATLSSPEKAKKVNGGQNLFAPNMGDKNKSESRGNNESSFEANTMSLPPRPQNLANSRVGNARMDAGNSEHYMGPPARSANHFGDHPDHNMQREEQRYEPHFNNMGYHPGMDHSFHEDAGYEFYGADYDYLYDERNDEYGFGNEPYPPHLHQRHPGPNTYYPRRPPPQGPRGPPQMFAPNDRGYGPPRPNMGGPSSRMGPNGPVGSRGPRSPMGPRGHRPQGGPGGPLGPPVMRGPPRGSPYGPPRGSPYGPPGPMRPQGMRGPPGPGMMGQAGHGGPAGPRPRLGPPARMQSPMPRQGSQPPGGPRPRMGPPPPRDDQYLPQRPAVVPPNTGDPSFCNPLPNFSQPPPNFVPSTSSLPPSTATAASAAQIADVVAPPPPLPPPKPPTPKPPPPPKKEEEKKEEIKPMTPLIPPEQAEQYRKLREQARKHARKQQRKQEHQAKGEPESSDDDDEEATAKKKEYEAKLSAEREEMEKAALLAVEDNGALHFEEGATILMPATQQTLMQQPTMMVQHHPLATQPSSYGLMPASHLLHAAHPGLHPSQLQNLQFMTSAGQPQLVQLPNGQMAYAMAAPMSYQTGAQMIAMPHQATMSAGAMPHHVLFSPGGMHQVPVTAHSGLTVSGSQYMAHVMASQVQAAQIQAAQAAQIQAAQAAQVQAAQAAQVQAVQAAQIQAAQVAQVQAVQAAQAQAVQAAQAQAAQVQSGMSGMVPGMHMAQHVLPAMHPQGQYILVPRVARPQM
ncbi:unnamed protein product [Candidula unifasciata]|uniref:Uncharacterized protein n=1 Tax=Candidula unifasciata TaxID=100452 RepID=A0A8S3ZT84_9EUPU|nr:unnamed protein product [Candidula unifasciata]